MIGGWDDGWMGGWMDGMKRGMRLVYVIVSWREKSTQAHVVGEHLQTANI